MTLVIAAYLLHHHLKIDLPFFQLPSGSSQYLFSKTERNPSVIQDHLLGNYHDLRDNNGSLYWSALNLRNQEQLPSVKEVQSSQFPTFFLDLLDQSGLIDENSVSMRSIHQNYREKLFQSGLTHLQNSYALAYPYRQIKLKIKTVLLFVVRLYSDTKRLLWEKFRRC